MQEKNQVYFDFDEIIIYFRKLKPNAIKAADYAVTPVLKGGAA
jgi:hypothetical protein